MLCDWLSRILLSHQDVANEKGILEQSEITLVSLTDTTLQDQEMIITEEEGAGELLKGEREEVQKDQETEVATQISVVCDSTLQLQLSFWSLYVNLIFSRGQSSHC